MFTANFMRKTRSNSTISRTETALFFRACFKNYYLYNTWSSTLKEKQMERKSVCSQVFGKDGQVQNLFVIQWKSLWTSFGSFSYSSRNILVLVNKKKIPYQFGNTRVSRGKVDNQKSASQPLRSSGGGGSFSGGYASKFAVSVAERIVGIIGGFSARVRSPSQLKPSNHLLKTILCLYRVTGGLLGLWNYLLVLLDVADASFLVAESFCRTVAAKHKTVVNLSE